MIFYSPRTNGFYRKNINGKNIPEDAVEIEDSQYEHLMLCQMDGGQIKSGVGGLPEIYDTSLAIGNLISLERLWRGLELARSDIELYKVQDFDIKATGSVGDWRSYRKELRAWPEDVNFPKQQFRPKAPDAE